MAVLTSAGLTRPPLPPQAPEPPTARPVSHRDAVAVAAAFAADYLSWDERDPMRRATALLAYWPPGTNPAALAFHGWEHASGRQDVDLAIPGAWVADPDGGVTVSVRVRVRTSRRRDPARLTASALGGPDEQGGPGEHPVDTRWRHIAVRLVRAADRWLVAPVNPFFDPAATSLVSAAAPGATAGGTLPWAQLPPTATDPTGSPAGSPPAEAGPHPASTHRRRISLLGWVALVQAAAIVAVLLAVAGVIDPAAFAPSPAIAFDAAVVLASGLQVWWMRGYLVAVRKGFLAPSPVTWGVRVLTAATALVGALLGSAGFAAVVVAGGGVVVAGLVLLLSWLPKLQGRAPAAAAAPPGRRGETVLDWLCLIAALGLWIATLVVPVLDPLVAVLATIVVSLVSTVPSVPRIWAGRDSAHPYYGLALLGLVGAVGPLLAGETAPIEWIYSGWLLALSVAMIALAHLGGSVRARPLARP